MDSTNLMLYFLVVLVTCITPGAGVLYTLQNALMYGKSRVFCSPTGVALGNLIMSIIAATGLGAVITSSPKLFAGLQIAGCLLMIYFGYKSWVAPPLSLSQRIESFKDPSPSKARFKIFSSAALLQLTNPMLIIFLLSLMPQFVSHTSSYALQLTVLISIFVVTCWLVHIIYSYSAAYAAGRWMNEKFSKIVNRTGAVLFWLISASVLVKLYAV
ncbi:LysE family translocator [uncultured Parasutterella sp.]|uniref:LysE family translocator n=1 Tax=uncultured Parasutterella sp. TaxID=1263098 RepID=UPI0025B68853|nr:LysE family translocator [uncultured Parasutterella sp.]